MNSPVCKQVIAMLSLYIEDKLDEEDKFFVQEHFKVCPDCYNKYLEMKEIINNLHFEYQKLLNEFEKIESNQIFNIREYEVFYKNISPYIDDELSYDDSIKFRRYLLKSKPARAELAGAYGLKNNIKNSVTKYKNNLNINFSKSIIKQLQEENKDKFENVYKRAAVVLGLMITGLLFASAYMGYSYFSDKNAQAQETGYAADLFDLMDDDDLIEFTFDGNNEALLTAK